MLRALVLTSRFRAIASFPCMTLLASVPTGRCGWGGAGQVCGSRVGSPGLISCSGSDVSDGKLSLTRGLSTSNRIASCWIINFCLHLCVLELRNEGGGHCSFRREISDQFLVTKWIANGYKQQ